MSWHYQRMYLELLADELEEQQENPEDSGEQRSGVNAAGDISGLGFTVVRVAQ